MEPAGDGTQNTSATKARLRAENPYNYILSFCFGVTLLQIFMNIG